MYNVFKRLIKIYANIRLFQKNFFHFFTFALICWDFMLSFKIHKPYNSILCDRVTGVLHLLKRKSKKYHIISAKKVLKFLKLQSHSVIKVKDIKINLYFRLNSKRNVH